MVALDTDSDGLVSLDEFLAFCRSRSGEAQGSPPETSGSFVPVNDMSPKKNDRAESPPSSPENGCNGLPSFSAALSAAAALVERQTIASSNRFGNQQPRYLRATHSWKMQKAPLSRGGDEAYKIGGRIGSAFKCQVIRGSRRRCVFPPLPTRRTLECIHRKGPVPFTMLRTASVSP